MGKSRFDRTLQGHASGVSPHLQQFAGGVVDALAALSVHAPSEDLDGVGLRRPSVANELLNTRGDIFTARNV